MTKVKRGFNGLVFGSQPLGYWGVGEEAQGLIALDLAQAKSEEEGEAFLSVGRAHVLLSRYKGEALREGCLCRVSNGGFGDSMGLFPNDEDQESVQGGSLLSLE